MNKTLPLLVSFVISLISCNTGYLNSSSMPALPSSAPSASDKSALAQLIGDSIMSKEELQLRDTLQRTIDLKFPIRVGVIYYGYTSQLEAKDQELLFEAAQNRLQQSGLIRDIFQIPSSLLGSGANIDTIRQLGARFQTDIVMIVSGSHTFEKSRSQPLSFFDSFTDRMYYQSHITLDVIALDIFSGTFLNPLRSVLQTEPTLFDRSAADFQSQTYQFRRDAESKVWQDLQEKFITTLKNLKQTIENRKTSPLPSPSVTPFPQILPFPAGGFSL